MLTLKLRLESREEEVKEELISDDDENPTVEEKVAQASHASTSRGSDLTFWE